MRTGHAVRCDLAPQGEMRASHRIATSFERPAAPIWAADTGPERQALGDEREVLCMSGARPSTRPTRLPGAPKKILARSSGGRSRTGAPDWSPNRCFARTLLVRQPVPAPLPRCLVKGGGAGARKLDRCDEQQVFPSRLIAEHLDQRLLGLRARRVELDRLVELTASKAPKEHASSEPELGGRY
jgi:hypothetical protein